MAFEVEAFPAMRLRRRVLIAVLAIATAAGVMFLMLRPPKKVPPQFIPDPHRCVGTESEACVGGKAMVIVTPMASAVAASAAR